MKSIVKAVVLYFMITIVSCSQHDEMLDKMEQTGLAINDTNSEVVNRLLDLGYNLSDIKELNDFFLVEGDILFSKNIKDYPDIKKEDRNLRHAHTNNLVYPTRLYITVRVDASIPTSGTNNWRPAVQSAITAWNDLPNCGLYFVYTTSNSAHITVKSDNGSLHLTGNVAAAGFPENGNPYHTIIINMHYNSGNVPEGTKRAAMMHELGHTVGFRHTNWEALGEQSGPSGLNEIPGMPLNDPNSVMNRPFNSAFSNYDKIAANYLYPFAARTESVIVSSYWDNDHYYEEKDFFLETYTKANYLTRFNLPTSRTVNYQLWEFWSNGGSSSSFPTNANKVLTVNLNRHYLASVVSNDCAYDTYGVPVGDCYQRWVSVTSLVLQ